MPWSVPDGPGSPTGRFARPEASVSFGRASVLFHAALRRGRRAAFLRQVLLADALAGSLRAPAWAALASTSAASGTCG